MPMPMFKHILMPVDGSLAMLPQVVRCLRFAADAGARVTALHVGKRDGRTVWT